MIWGAGIENREKKMKKNKSAPSPGKKNFKRKICANSEYLWKNVVVETI